MTPRDVHGSTLGAFWASMLAALVAVMAIVINYLFFRSQLDPNVINKELHARENVIHEAELFQGKLGFKRGIILLEEGCSEYSNLAGVQQLRYSSGNIKEVFGDVISIIYREFGADE